MMWQGHLTMKNEPAEVQIYFVSGNEEVAKRSLLKNEDGSTTPLKIINRMRLDAVQSEGLHDKMQVGSLKFKSSVYKTCWPLTDCQRSLCACCVAVR